jgi:1,4-alpha-glucan branching enzyme
MLYLDYGREEGQWIPNQYGGKENVDAIDFLRRFNERVYAEHPEVVTFAEESTSWPMVSAPTYLGGLGFGFKWNMGWMNDVLRYFSRDSVFRKYHQNDLTFSMVYAFSENFLLPFSHDEVVHGKASLISKMPGDDWQKFANLRALFAYMYGHPGKKLLFMGCEFAQWEEWSHDTSLDWNLLAFEPHRGMQRLVRDLNTLYRAESALHEQDADWRGFEWIDCNDSQSNALTFIRKGTVPEDVLLFGCNFSPVPRHGYRIGCPLGGMWREVFNSDASIYGGTDCGNLGGVQAQDFATHGRPHTLEVTLPPLGVVVFKPGQ